MVGTALDGEVLPQSSLVVNHGACPVNTDTPTIPTIHAIQSVVARRFGVTIIDLLSRRRARAVARPRQVAMWLARKMTLNSLPEIGRAFAHRDHTTVMHAIAVIDRLMEADRVFAHAVWNAEFDIERLAASEPQWTYSARALV